MKRRVIQPRVVVFLLLFISGGAIVNVAVAWGCFITQTSQWQRVNTGDKVMSTRFGATRVDRFFGRNTNATGTIQLASDHICTYAGIPMRSVQLPPMRSEAQSILASHPVWIGFVVNTIFYAAMIWTIFFAPGMLKRTLRRRRGQCPACAYPVGTSPVCTECGAAVKPVGTTDATPGGE